MLLRNRTFTGRAAGVPFNVQVTKSGDQPILEATQESDPMQGVQVAAAYAEIAKDVITHAAFTIGGVFVACQIIKKVCK